VTRVWELPRRAVSTLEHFGNASVEAFGAGPKRRSKMADRWQLIRGRAQNYQITIIRRSLSAVAYR
jgi:hypothetical protein